MLDRHRDGELLITEFDLVCRFLAVVEIFDELDIRRRNRHFGCDLTVKLVLALDEIRFTSRKTPSIFRFVNSDRRDMIEREHKPHNFLRSNAASKNQPTLFTCERARRSNTLHQK